MKHSVLIYFINIPRRVAMGKFVHRFTSIGNGTAWLFKNNKPCFVKVYDILCKSGTEMYCKFRN